MLDLFSHLIVFIMGFLFAWVFFLSLLKRYVNLLENMDYLIRTQPRLTNPDLTEFTE